MDDQRPCETEYSRVPSEYIYVYDYTKESAAEKGEGEEKEVMQDERGGVPRGGEAVSGGGG